MRSIGGLLSIGRRPPLFDLAERRRVEVVELVPALSPGPDEPSLLEDVEVLRDRLAGRSEAVVADQPDAELEQRLAIALLQLIEDRPAGRVGECLVEIAHHADDRQAQTCMSTPGRVSRPVRHESRTAAGAQVPRWLPAPLRSRTPRPEFRGHSRSPSSNDRYERADLARLRLSWPSPTETRPGPLHRATTHSCPSGERALP